MSQCPHCQSHQLIKKGHYFIKHSRSWIRRLKCSDCLKTFSSRTFSKTYNQKKPFLNSPVFQLLMSGNTQRRAARLLKCSRLTIERKLAWLNQHKNLRCSLGTSLHLQIDELETIEHTKLKPLTIPICVDADYQILAVTVGRIRAKGHLSRISLKKYGPREDQREKALNELFEKLRSKLRQDPITITTDAHPLYGSFVKTYFPQSEHIVVNSGESVKKKRELVYTAERKKIFDPLFALNQRCAMLRADIRRLTRRSWCTTKKVENLRRHLELYQIYNNEQLLLN